MRGDEGGGVGAGCRLSRHGPSRWFPLSKGYIKNVHSNQIRKCWSRVPSLARMTSRAVLGPHPGRCVGAAPLRGNWGCRRTRRHSKEHDGLLAVDPHPYCSTETKRSEIHVRQRGECARRGVREVVFYPRPRDYRRFGFDPSPCLALSSAGPLVRLSAMISPLPLPTFSPVTFSMTSSTFVAFFGIGALGT